MDKSQRVKVYALVLVGLGWLISAYLMMRQVTLGAVSLRWNPGIGAGSLCPGCDYALASAITVAKFPLAGVGLVYFGLLGILLALGGRWADRAAFVVCSAGTGVSVLLASMLFGTSGPFCTFCLAVHAANVALLALLFVIVSQQLAEDAGSLGMLGSAKGWVAIGLIAMISSGLLQASMIRQGLDPAKLLAEYRSSPQFQIPMQNADAVLGPRDGKVKLVVFSSFQCPWCQVFSRNVHPLQERFGDRLTIVFKNFPLGKDCNPSLRAEMQPRACAAAYAAEAANLQKNFWVYHDSLFADSMADSDEILLASARGAGLDLNRWEEDRQSPETKLKISADVLIGMRLSVEGTPTVFLNGRKVKNPSLNVLEVLIDDAIKSS